MQKRNRRLRQTFYTTLSLLQLDPYRLSHCLELILTFWFDHLACFRKEFSLNTLAMVDLLNMTLRTHRGYTCTKP